MSASLFDANIWVAATFPSHPFHAPALTALEAATPDAPAVFCRATQVSFLRLATTPKLLQHYGARGVSNDDILAGLHILLSRPSVAEMDEPAGTAALWLRLASRDTASPKVWMDSYLAAFAIRGEMRFVSLDHDFKVYRAHGLDLALLNP